VVKIKARCACSGFIEAEPDEASITNAVRVHQRQPEHRAEWEAYKQNAERKSGPDVPMGPSSIFYVKKVA